MQEFHIRFYSFRDVQEFVAMATEQAFPIMVGSDSYQVNSTSLMGMFSLDYSKPLRVRVHCTEEEFEGFKHRLERFLVK